MVSADIFAGESAVIDANVLFDFLAISFLKELTEVFQSAYIVSSVYAQVELPRQKAVVDALIGKGCIEIIEPDQHEQFQAAFAAKRAYGKVVEQADRETCAVAKRMGFFLITRDTPMCKVAVDYFKMDPLRIMRTNDCLKRLVKAGVITEEEGKKLLSKVNRRRHPRPPLKW